jgi:hypothetical protein
MSSADASRDPAAAGALRGALYVYVAFDWGEEISLEQARQLAGGDVLDLIRRPRTPGSISYKPPPLRVPLATSAAELPGLGRVAAPTALATVFDFGAVSVAMRIPFALPAQELLGAAGGLAEPATAMQLIRVARAAVEPLYQTLQPAVRTPLWVDNLWEEYFLFQLHPGEPLQPEQLMGPLSGWMAGLVRLEDQPLCSGEVTEALRLALRYGPCDLFVPDWAAAVLLDAEQEAGETLQTIEFANLQLLEYRHIDNRLDEVVSQAYRLLQRASRRRLPFLRGHGRALRLLGELKVEASGLFERTGNVLKLIGDQYLARVYELLATRFHLRDWQRSIERKLEAVEGVYQVIADQSNTFRMEFLEIVVILLIVLELILAFLRH